MDDTRKIDLIVSINRKFKDFLNLKDGVINDKDSRLNNLYEKFLVLCEINKDRDTFIGIETPADILHTIQSFIEIENLDIDYLGVQKFIYPVEYSERWRELANNEERHEEIKNITVMKLDSYMHNVEEFYKIQPFFYDKSKIFWFWNYNKYCYEIVDDTDVMRILDKKLSFYGQTVNSTIKNNYLEAFKRVGREKQPKEAPKKWIQFKDKAFSLTSKKVYKVTPHYFFTNPIPHELGNSEDTPVMDRLFTQWLGENNKMQLYELLAYCCYTDYPIQLLICLHGSGRNGKSQYLKILDKFIGKDNTTSSDLDILTTNNFESFNLYRKLCCLIGETNFAVLEKSSIIKKLVGGDKVRFEKKGKDSFSDYNYSKIIIASNNLPSSRDTSDGFFRRWLIIKFPNEFEDIGKEVWEEIPQEEYNNLAKKVTSILPVLLKRGMFTNQGSIEDRKELYISVSNPLSQFIDQCCEKDEHSFELCSKLYTAYVQYLQKLKSRKVTLKEFKAALEDEGLYIERTTKTFKHLDDMGNERSEYKSGQYVEGIKLKNDIMSVMSVINFSILGKNTIGETKKHCINHTINIKPADFIINQLKNHTNMADLEKLFTANYPLGDIDMFLEALQERGEIYKKPNNEWGVL